MNEYELFQSALNIEDPVARAKYLDASCAKNQAMLKRVEALLASHDGQSQFLNTPVVEQLEKIVESPIPNRGRNRSGERLPQDEDPNATEILSSRSNSDSESQDEQEDEIPLGYLEPSSKPGSLGRLSHYEILEVVGRGAFGTVLRAFDERLQRVVAIKVLALELAATSPARKRFMREARASAAIRHENVVSVYAVEEKPLPYLVMEYIPGRTLQQRLKERGPLDVSTVLRLGRQIAEGLAAAHAQELIHRDIKPGNILLETSVQDRVKITDFGLARAADDASLTQSGMIAGTPMYMAPEQALGHKLDQRADLFSFGSLLYQMISGRPPFRANSTLSVMKRVAEDTPRPIREIIPETPQWLCDIITKLHAKNPDDRYQTAREIANVLANCESQLETHSVVNDFSSIQKPKKLHAGLWRWLAAGAIALPLFTVGFFVLTTRPTSPVASENSLERATLDPNKLDLTKRERTNRNNTAIQQAEQAASQSEGWVQLFNGKDLTGWKLHPDQSGQWEVRDSILIGSARQSYLFSQRGDYGNFHLRAEAKVNLGGDSGVLFRAPFELRQGRTSQEFGVPGCYEVELQKKPFV